MALESAADLAGFFDTTAHGVSASITINGSSSTINVIFNKDYFAIDPGTGIDIESTSPIVTGASSDMTNVDNGDTISISSVTYNIVSVEPDGQGVTQLVLEKQ
tara:strand:- start:359 stop:667 length:309 start_codon:yes stop_codon:yes gene_type:complete